MLLVTHDLDHAWAIADRFTLLARGRVLRSAHRSETDRGEVQRAMAGGRAVQLSRRLDQA